MSAGAEISGFLRSRRARITPDAAGVQPFGGRRRVPGLRREEVAHLAGVSTDYYAQLERGNAKGASREVLEAIARALHLDDTETEHLLHLAAGTSGPARRRRRPSTRVTVDAGTQAVLDALSTPAIVQNRRLDVIGANRLGAALYGMPDPRTAEAPFNSARFQFLDPRAAEFFVDADQAARNVVALLHQAAGRDPHDDELQRLIGALSTRSERFRTLWATHDVIRFLRGAKHYRHPDVGELVFGYESFELTTDPGSTMLVYTVEPNSPTAERLAILGALSALPAAATSAAAATDDH
ncbi:transcriptional regulator [Curtobacterium sp. BH-2-1-1]|uniref:helix-turn-helix domain-containing protein n=1 Tax=Curtobacterium sp. BH-2-1-1 TaxID=1905847 RepID=UPI00089E065C|nr:helix-turn-helix transcriptional regulator [Curtobacterium sp. BH-2-1-1]AOX66235.1 transcriptional regulator [Curtobacterium sp. BH-2-1-1]